MYGFNQLSVIARKGVGRAFSSLIICSSMKGIFHLTVLVAAGETERAFRSKILESWGGSSWASAFAVGEAGDSMALSGGSESVKLVGGTVTGGSLGEIAEFVGSTEPLAQLPVFGFEVLIFWHPFGILSRL